MNEIKNSNGREQDDKEEKIRKIIGINEGYEKSKV